MADKPSPDAPLLDDLRRAYITRAQARASHRPCRNHGDTRVVCPSCGKMMCPYCSTACLKCAYGPLPARVREEDPAPMPTPVTKKRAAYPPSHLVGRTLLPNDATPLMHAIARTFSSLGLRTITVHADSGGYAMVFPFLVNGIRSSADLSSIVWRLAKDAALPIEPTPFGSGRWFNPDRWFVSYRETDPATPASPESVS